MGTGRAFSLHETDDTRAASRDAEFEKIIERIESSGGEIVMDETTPLFVDIGNQEFELGTQRVVEFTTKEGLDFQLTRKVEDFILQGQGHQKHTEPLTPPRAKIVLKKRNNPMSDWQIMDFEDIF